MDLPKTRPIRPGLAPMEARLVDELPRGEGWQPEPKWDSFRCLVVGKADSWAEMTELAQDLSAG